MKRNLLWLVALAIFAGADPYHPTPKFAGKVVPDPPHQRDPWTPPGTKLPRFLVTATAALYDAGMADPRGCEYREVEIGDWTLVKTRGFVMPERPGDSGRFVVGWNGIVYPAVSVGSEADIEADARAMAGAARKGRDEAAVPARRWYERGGGFAGMHNQSRGFLMAGMSVGGPPPPSPLALAVLLRLGRADLAEMLFAAGTIWTPETPRRDLTDYHVTFLTLANEWGGNDYGRLLSAHVRADDAVALAAARRLSAFRKAVDAYAQAKGFAVPARQNWDPDRTSYIGPFVQLAELLADHERRAQEPPRGPIPKRGGDPSARIAAMIRDFDQIHVDQFSSLSSANPGAAPIVHDLAAEGDPAVKPLLTALETDTRLTRSITGGRGPVYIHPVTDVIYAALIEILQTKSFMEQGADFSELRTPAGRKRLASTIRVYWEKNRAVPLAERWYRTLLDDSAGTDRWLDAAQMITLASATTPRAFPGFVVAPGPGRPPAIMGEALRSRRDPSVSDLMSRRVADIARTGNPFSIPDIGLIRACEMAEAFARWDLPASLPTLRTHMATCRDRTKSIPQGHQSDQGLGRYASRFTLLRERGGDHAAIDEYATWIKEVPLPMIEASLFSTLEPMWYYSRHPAITEAARAMFTDPKSPWLPFVFRDRIQVGPPSRDLIASPLVCLEAFRQALLTALGDKRLAGTASLAKEGGVSVELTSGVTGGFGDSRTPSPEDKPDVEVPFRACDLIVWKLSTLEGAPESRPYWDEARRDKAVLACADYLRRYGARLSVEELPDEHDFPHARAHLRFPALGKPASAEDVREARAIFSLQGEGKARVPALPANFPVRARWTALKAFPIDQHLGDGSTHRAFLQDGWVWQAEEIRKGDRWERFYGFVGHATIARVPASEILFPLDPYQSATIPGGLAAQVSLADPASTGHAPGEPIVVTMRLRNGLGVDREVPTDFVRPGDDGRQALRRGVTLTLFDVPKNPYGSGSPAMTPPGPREPTRRAQFDPGGASRTLGPTESFEALRVDLRDWFGTLGPGSYHVRIAVSQDSGIGNGTSGGGNFSIRTEEMP